MKKLFLVALILSMFTVGAFAIDRLYTSGFLFAGKTIVDIADATDVEELQGNN